MIKLIGTDHKKIIIWLLIFIATSAGLTNVFLIINQFKNISISYELRIYLYFVLSSTIAFPSLIGIIFLRLLNTIENLQVSKKRADRATEAKITLMSNASHDIGNSISGMKGCAEKLYKIPNMDKDFYTALSVIIKETNSIANSISLFRDRVMFETGESRINSIPCSIVTILNKVYNFNIERAKLKNLNFLYNYTIEDIIYRVDNIKLEAILNILIDNSLKFTKHGKIQLNCKQIQDGKEFSTLYFEVIDEGIGVPHESRETIFEMYEQAHKTTYAEYGGFGQGLAICKKYLTLLGSTINVHNNEPRGTIFSFSLTLDKVPTTSDIFNHICDQPFDPPHRSIKNIRILAADDSPSLQMVIDDKLEELGLIHKIVSDGKEALDELHTSEYDLLLLDIRMPIMGGIELIKIIRSEDNDIPVIALTANYSEAEQLEYLKLGFNKCLGKPVDIEKLRSVINEILNINL